MQTSYVVGFLFRSQGKEVALIRKLKPEFQRGKLNGVGGKIEDGETPLNAMCREWREETGSVVVDWTGFASLVAGEALIHFFSAFGGDAVKLSSPTDEEVNWFEVICLDIMPRMKNLDWLIPMALDPDQPFSICENKV